jgi:hypothetical protein
MRRGTPLRAPVVVMSIVRSAASARAISWSVATAGPYPRPGAAPGHHEGFPDRRSSLYAPGVVTVAVVVAVIVVAALAGLAAVRFVGRRRLAGGRGHRPNPTYVGRLEPRGAVVYVQQADGLRELRPAHEGDRGEFGWGYEGLGPRRLAIAVLTDLYGVFPPRGVAPRFADEVLRPLSPTEFELRAAEIDVWVDQDRQRTAALR